MNISRICITKTNKRNVLLRFRRVMLAVSYKRLRERRCQIRLRPLMKGLIKPTNYGLFATFYCAREGGQNLLPIML